MRCGDEAWLDELQRTFEAVVAEAGDAAQGVTFAISEQYDEPPADLRPGAGPSGWTFRLTDGRGGLRRSPSTDVDVHVRLDHAVFDELARVVVDGDPARAAWLAERAGAAIATGTMVVTGSLDTAPSWLMPAVHDRMARAVLDADAEVRS
jgi:hypothetical protein